VGQDWRSGGLPQGREGSICKLEPAAGWLFAGIDAGPATASPSNEKQFISSVLCWDGFGWHEILRGYYPGMRIQNVKWQACEDARHRLWTSIEGDLVYQVFPLNKASPILDTSIEYQHEGVLTSSIIDMGAASSLPKYIRGLTATTKGLTSGVQVDVDYQVDDDIDTSTWTNAPSFVISPEQEIEINEGDIRQFRYRLRLNTNDATVAPDVKGIVPNGFARVPWRKVWHVRIKAGLIQDLAGRRNMKPDKFLAWLDDVARFPGRVFMTSDKYPTMDKKWVVISPPTMTPLTPQTPDIDPTSSIMINLMEA